MRVQGALAPCCPFLGAVCTLQLINQRPRSHVGECLLISLLGPWTRGVCPGSVLPGPQELCKQGPQEGGRPPVPEHSDLRGQLQCQGACGGLLPGCG